MNVLRSHWRMKIQSANKKGVKYTHKLPDFVQNRRKTYTSPTYEQLHIRNF